MIQDIPIYDTDEITGVINNTFENLLNINSIGFSVLQGVTGLAIIFIFIKLVVTGVQVVADPDRGLSFKSDFQPLLIMILVVTLWIPLFNFINWGVMYIKSALDTSLDTQGYALGSVGHFSNLLAPFIEAGNLDYEFSLLSSDSWNSLFFEIALSMVEFFSWLVATIDTGVYIIFYTMVKIWVSILAILAPISLVLSFFTKLKDSIDTWLRNYIQVNLWTVVMLVMLYISDTVYIALSEYMVIIDQVIFEAEGGMGAIGKAMWIIVSYVPFLILKIILVFKIPQLVGMIIGGSSGGSGGLFMAAFAPIKVVGSAGAKMATKFKK